MKKVIAILAAASVAGVAAADISVDLQNSGKTFTTGGGAAGADVTVQLIWNDGQTVESGSGIQVGANLLAAGDVELAKFDTTAGYWGTWSDLGNQGGVYAQDLSGYLTLRVFDNTTVGSLGFEFDIDVDGTLTEFDSLVASTTYQTDTKLGGDFDSLVKGQANVVEVIPEPATLGMMGVAGLGMYLARRKARA